MTRLLLDRTLRSAPTVNPRLWSEFGPGNQTPKEEGGVWDFSPLTTAYARHVVSKLPALTLDQGILLRIKRTGTGTSRFRVWLAHSGVTSGSTGEVATNGLFAMVTNAGALSLGQTVAGVTTETVAPVANRVGNNVDTWLRMERTAGVVRARTWADGATEPTTWDVSAPDDLTTVPAGQAGVSFYRGGSSVTLFVAGKVTLYTPAGGIPEASRAKLYHRPDGTRISYGRQSHTRRDDGAEVQASWLTGTTTQDVVNAVRTLAAAAGATAAVTGQPAAADAHILTVHNLRLSTDTDAGIALRFTDGTTNFELRQDAADDAARLVAGAATQPLTHRLRKNGEGPRHRTLTLILAPRVGQLIAMEGDFKDGAVLGWINLPAGISRTTALTPSLLVTAGAAQQTAGYTGLTVETQRL